MGAVLITGGLGFVGGRLAKKMSGHFNVLVSSRKTASSGLLALHGPVSQVNHQDLLSKDTFPKGIDTVIHLAAMNEWDCVRSPSEAIRVNIDETRIILENSIANGAGHFIYFSTAHIYGSPLRGIITEDNLAVPVHPYAITHKAAEDYVLAAALQRKIHGIIIRLSNSFGPPVDRDVNRWTLLANDLSRQAVEKRKLTLLSNGCQFRDFICLTDVENVLYDMLYRGPQNYQKHIYNLGSGVAMRVIDMASNIAACYAEITGKEIPIDMPAGAVPTVEPGLHINIDRLLADNFIIRNDFQNEIRQLLIYCHKNFKPFD